MSSGSSTGLTCCILYTAHRTMMDAIITAVFFIGTIVEKTPSDSIEAVPVNLDLH